MQPSRRFAAHFAFALVMISQSFAARAQTQPAPGQVPSREQVELPRPKQDQRQSRVRVDSKASVADQTCHFRGPEFDSLRLNVDRLTFTGPGGAELAPEVREVLAPMAPPPASSRLEVICGLQDRANELVSQAGYVASVVVPPQTIDSGELRFEVITARIVEVRVHGDAPPYRRTLEARVDQLKALNPLNRRDAERILLVAGDIPGLDVQLALRRGTATGEVIGDLVIQYRPFSIFGNVNNYGSPQLGRETAFVRAEAYGLIGLQDVTYVGASTTLDFEEQRVVQIGEVIGLGDGGMTLEGSFLYAWSRPDVGILDLRSESLVGSLALSAPLRRSRRQAIDLTGGLELIEQRTRVFSGGAGAPLNRDKLRVAFLRADAELRGFLPTGREAYSVTGSLEVRQGLGILDATRRGEISPGGFTPTRFSGDPTALVVRASLDGVAGLGAGFSLAGRARGQWANNPLLNFEEFSIGNLTIGRGYDPGANSADRAIGLRAEPRFTVHDDGETRVDLFGFYDSVWIWNLDPNAVETGRRLGSWGGGVRAVIAGLGLAEIAYARPEDRALLIPGTQRATDRLLVSLTFQFPRGGR
ncbi:MAG TPA: ShlB/FhaC/HecB family hemolysin secretion/activation protein [Allosphingosinicella sp.]|jgi:hemolysin activation/secretion protein